MQTIKASKETFYSIWIQTKDSSNIGNVYLSLNGDKTNVEKLQLKVNKSNTTPFRKEQSDEFEIKAVDVGHVIYINKIIYFSLINYLTYKNKIRFLK